MAPSSFAVSDGFLLNQIVTEYQPLVISDRSINQFPPRQAARSVLVSNCGLDHNTTHLFQQAPTTLSTCESNALM